MNTTKITNHIQKSIPNLIMDVTRENDHSFFSYILKKKEKVFLVGTCEILGEKKLSVSLFEGVRKNKSSINYKRIFKKGSYTEITKFLDNHFKNL